MSGYSVLMYHALNTSPDEKERYVLTARQFREHMALIRDTGFVGSSFSDFSRKRVDNSEKLVIITFDDGHISNFHVALPILQEVGFSATFFVTTARIGSSPDWLTWEHLQHLLNAGMDIQVHGHTHEFFDSLSKRLQIEELEAPRRLVRRHLNHAPTSFSFPGGRYTNFAVKTAYRIGYQALFTSEPGLNSLDSTNRRRPIKRFVVHRGVSHKQLRKIINGHIAFIASAGLTYRCKKHLKTLLGNKLYHALWTMLLKGKKA